MQEPVNSNIPFEEDAPRNDAADASGGLIVNLDGYDGPLDLLLDLARDQKVDLIQISILQLAEQFIEYIKKAKELQLSVAADYLVMAAWLAYLKSRLLVPSEKAVDEPTGEELAARLNLQLRRLDAIRDAADKLFQQPREGVQFHLRGAPDGIRQLRRSEWDCELIDLLQAYAARQEAMGVREPVALRRHLVISVEQALERMERLLGDMPDWADLMNYLPTGLRHSFTRRSARASTLVAALELAKQGRIDIAQAENFGPIRVRAKRAENE